MTISLIIATYNWPEALEQVLESVKRQTRVPDEVLIADDGSGEPTRAVVERFQRDFPCPLIHVWHEDNGFRLAAIRNRAIERSRGDYIIQIDGDCIADSHFIEDHAREAKRGCFCSGGRILCGEELSRRILARERVGRIGFLTKGINNRFNAMRIPLLTRILRSRYRVNEPWMVKGCNMAFWRDDLLAVNGYNEAMTGWGHEDSELAIRLDKLGRERLFLKFGARLFHLYHHEADRSHRLENVGMLTKACISGFFWTPHGIVKSEEPIAAGTEGGEL